MISCGPRRSTSVLTTATVPTRVRSSSTDAAPMVARGTVRHLRSSSQPHLFSSFGWDQRYAYRNGSPVNSGLSNSIAQGQAQRDVGVDDQEEGQRPSTEV